MAQMCMESSARWFWHYPATGSTGFKSRLSAVWCCGAMLRGHRFVYGGNSSGRKCHYTQYRPVLARIICICDGADMEYVCIHSDGAPVLGDLSAAAGGNRSFAGRPDIFVLVISPYRPITNVIPPPDSGAVFFTSDIKFLAVLPIIAMEMMSFLGFY